LNEHAQANVLGPASTIFPPDAKVHVFPVASGRYNGSEVFAKTCGGGSGVPLPPPPPPHAANNNEQATAIKADAVDFMQPPFGRRVPSPGSK
jgi:hypothetical protein